MGHRLSNRLGPHDASCYMEMSTGRIEPDTSDVTRLPFAHMEMSTGRIEPDTSDVTRLPFALAGIGSFGHFGPLQGVFLEQKVRR